MSLLARIKNYKRAKQHERNSDAASRQMQKAAQVDVEARLTAMEIRLRNELHRQ